MKTCVDCGQEFERPELKVLGKVLFSPKLCPSCVDKRADEAEWNRLANEQEALWSGFWSQVPVIYRDTDEKRLNAKLLAAAMKWQYGPKGLGFIGSSGAGKTRTAIYLLQKHFPVQKSFCFLKATKLTKYAAEKFSDDKDERGIARQVISSAYKSKVLVIDDIGKGRLPVTAEELLFDVIDERSENGLPIIWTSNCSVKELHGLLSVDKADPIIRRLKEFTTIVSV